MRSYTDECQECAQGQHYVWCPRKDDEPTTAECEECGCLGHDPDCPRVAHNIRIGAP